MTFYEFETEKGFASRTSFEIAHANRLVNDQAFVFGLLSALPVAAEASLPGLIGLR